VSTRLALSPFSAIMSESLFAMHILQRLCQIGNNYTITWLKLQRIVELSVTQLCWGEQVTSEPKERNCLSIHVICLIIYVKNWIMFHLLNFHPCEHFQAKTRINSFYVTSSWSAVYWEYWIDSYPVKLMTLDKTISGKIAWVLT